MTRSTGAEGVSEVVETLAIGQIRIARAFSDHLVCPNDLAVSGQALGRGLGDIRALARWMHPR